MLTHMEVDSALPDPPALSLGGFSPNLDSIEVRNIDGLGPAAAAISSVPYAIQRGEFFQGSSTSPRNIVITLGMNPNWLTETQSSIRRDLYRYFMQESLIHLVFSSDDMEDVYIDGVVETCEPNIFSQDPEMLISIICSRPDFIAVAAVTVTGTTDASPVEVDYAGTVSTGFLLDIDGTGGHDGDVEISNEIGPFSQDFLVNDISLDSTWGLRLNTLHGQRKVLRHSTDEDSSLLHKSASNATWPEFSPGPNSFTVHTGSDALAWSLTYHNRYGGL